jgi:D-alanyl-D-alanine carboxypeptidase
MSSFVRRSTAVLAALAAMAVFALQANASREPSVGKLQRSLDELVSAGVPGAVLLVRNGDRTIRLSSGYGNLKTRTPIRAMDRFRVGSITKTFVATVVLQLVEERKLALDDTVERRLPGLVPTGRRITLRQLLNHTSGLFDYGGDEKWLSAAFRDPVRDWSPREIVSIATAHKPYFPPGKGWAYSNTNYYVLGLIVEATTGRPLADELRRRILAPLRLRATSLPTGPRIAGAHARGYFLGPIEDVTVGSPSVVWASGALVSNADDLARFFRALLGGRLLRPDLLRAMKSTIQGVPEFAYGLGLEKMRGPCGQLWGHTGGSPGYSVDALNSIDGKRQVVVLVNGTAMLAPSVKEFQAFNLPQRARPALERLVETAYCG